MPYRSWIPAIRVARWAAIVFLPIAASVATAYSSSNQDPEDFRVELTGSAWLVDTSGSIQASGTLVNLISDLGASQQQPTFFGQFVFKPTRRQRIIVEGTPFRISGHSTVDRTIVYGGETFNNQTVNSSADLNYFFAGYQYDVLSGRAGHLGFSAGGAYLGTTGSIRSLQPIVTASKSETVGLPLAGVEARVFPIPGHKLLTLEADMRGMDFGSYGHYLEGSASGGITVGPVSFLAGYRDVNPDVHSGRTGNPEGVDVHLKGPIFSLQWRLPVAR